MSQVNATGIKGFEVNGAIGKHILVKLVAGPKVAVAALGEEFIGTLREQAFADADVHSVFLKTKPGTMKCIAAGAFAIGATVYGRALGKVDDDSATSAKRVGIAMEAATAAGDEIEVMVDG